MRSHSTSSTRQHSPIPAGERDLPEWEASWLLGHHRSAPVRVGNAAAGQFQDDVYGEVADAMYGLMADNGFRSGQQQIIRRVLHVLEGAWLQPDKGIWEIRGSRLHSLLSRVDHGVRSRGATMSTGFLSRVPAKDVASVDDAANGP